MFCVPYVHGSCLCVVDVYWIVLPVWWVIGFYALFSNCMSIVSKIRFLVMVLKVRFVCWGCLCRTFPRSYFSLCDVSCPLFFLPLCVFTFCCCITMLDEVSLSQVAVKVNA